MSILAFLHSPRVTALALLVGFGAPTAWLGVHQARLRVDPTNRSLKSIDTDAARGKARMEASFGSDQALLFGFAAPPGLRIEATELEALGRVRESAAALPGVGRAGAVRCADPSFAVLEVALDDAGAAPAVVDRVRADAPETLHVRATGAPLVEARIATAVTGERAALVPMIALVLFVALAWIYRSVRIPLVILLPAGAAILWVGGLIELLGRELDPLLALLDPLLLTVGVAGSVHIVEAYARQHAALGPRAAGAAARRKLLEPMSLTVITSMVGFLSLLTSAIPAVGDFGVFAALGVAVSTALALWTVPVLLAAVVPDGVRPPRLRTSVFHYVAWLQTASMKILVVFVAVAAVLLARAGDVRIDNDPLRILAPGDRLREATEDLSARLGGVETAGMLVPHDSPAAAPGLTRLLCADLLDRAAVVGAPAPALQAEDGDRLVRVTLARSGSQDREALFAALDAFHADVGCDDVRMTGATVQVAQDSGALIRGQLYGLLLVVPLLGITVALGMRSLRLGLLSLVPNAVPCLLLQGGMALLGRPLSVATVMIGAVMMGLIVDDTIHLLHGVRSAAMHGRSRRMALAHALRSCGRAVTVTSVVLFLGLGAGCLGELSTTVEFSALAAVTILVAWVLDVVVLPCFLLCWRGALPVRPHRTP